MQSLKVIQQGIWQQFIDAQNDRNHPFRLGAFATVGGNSANLRTIVIRKVIPENSALWFYTDYRSPKVQEIQTNPNIAWLFYDTIERTQVRLYGITELLRNTSINHYIWQQLPEHSKMDYLTQNAPGTIKEDSKTDLLDREGAKNFCIVKTNIHRIDWLQLGRKEHSRASFELIDGVWEGKWLVA